MGHAYQAISWNRFKKRYDLLLWAFNLTYLGIFIALNIILFPQHNVNTILIRALGTLAILLLHFILIIGPASRFIPKLLPLLYNRRHAGVSMFLVATAHGVLSLIWFHGGSNTPVLDSLFTSNMHYDSLQFFPFQTLGFFALLILAAMAFTSHDVWLNVLSPATWKVLHMLVYVAYALVMAHVALGVLQLEDNPILVILLYTGCFTITALHLMAAWKERVDAKTVVHEWLYVANLPEMENNRAKIVEGKDERIAVFLYDNKLSAVSNVCKHQLGPIGEGKIVDGCITCPWHGYQYRPGDGCAPPPFTEKLATFRLKVEEQKIFVDPNPLPEGTSVEPIRTDLTANTTKDKPFFIGWDAVGLGIQSRFAFNIAITMMGIALLIGIVFTINQQKITPYQIDYTQIKQMKGWLTKEPVPMLTIVAGKDDSGNPVFKSILLVDALKKGADNTISSYLKNNKNSYVEITGYLSTNPLSCGTDSASCKDRCKQCLTGTLSTPLMEIENGLFSIKQQEPPAGITLQSALLPGKDITITGEIIDPKCYFGAMNPGYGKPHLSCAVRCISGGIMPVLRYSENGKEQFAVLLSATGKPVNEQVLAVIGLPVKITGKLSDMNNWQILNIFSLQANTH
jgi:nitrite reductase/ring-hydroxylating ferredoxin subunit/DMSO/TMAO reductase YedYZ heme-binding membrane subunit